MKTITLSILALLISSAMQAQIIHVPGDYPTIQQGINHANPGDTVLVSEGTYYEQINFKGKKPLMVTSQYLMDGDTNHIASTIIDGSQLTNLDSASVVYFVSGEDTTSILCGFTIRNGKGTYTPDNWDDRQGGGIWIAGAGAKIIHNRITHNILDDTQPGNGNSTAGGGIGSKYEDAGYWLVIANNTIDSNTCISKYDYAVGGGINTCYNVRIVNNYISYNTCSGIQNAASSGGGMWCGVDSSWTTPIISIVENNTITHNSTQSENNYANTAGGNYVCIQVIFSNNEVSYNTVITEPNYGGGAGGIALLHVDPGCVVSNNVFRGNVSNLWTGGCMVENFEILDNQVLVENNYFFNNRAEYGGGFTTLSAPVTLQNNVFNGNRSIYGGAMALVNGIGVPGNHMATVINNSFSKDTATGYGGAIYSEDANPLVLNSIFWQDLSSNGKEIYVQSGSVEMAYSNIDPNMIFPTYIDGGGNINEDPMFADPETLKPGHNSPCIDHGIMDYTCSHGSTVNAPEYDINGLSRPRESGWDMGAYEHSAIIHVPADYPTIQAGIDAADPGETVLVSNGTYFEQISFKGKKPLTVASEFLIDGDTSHISHTIIDGSHASDPDSASVVYFISGEDTTSVLCGFTVQNGKGTHWFWEGLDSIFENLGGGGVYISRSTATIRDNIIRNNVVNDTPWPDLSGSCGGGIHASFGLPGTVVIEGNTISSNAVYTNHLWAEAGGVYIFATNSSVRNNLISENISKNTQGSIEWAHGTAGGIMCEGDTIPVIATITDNLVKGNEAHGQMMGYGGGMVSSGLAEGSLIKNNVFENNSQNWFGGAIEFLLTESNVKLEDNYFHANSAAYGGAIDIYSVGNNVKIQNNYFNGNSAGFGGAIDVWDFGSHIFFLNNVFVSNQASEQGGAFCLNRMEGSTAEHLAVIINSSFYNNQAGTLGDAIYSYDYHPLIFNSIFWNNSDPQSNIIVVDQDTVEIAYSDIDTNKIAGTRIIGAGMINADPLFSDITKLFVDPVSPCVDKGVAKYTCSHGMTFQSPDKDILGNLRPVGNGYDMGAYDTLAPGGILRITRYGLRITNWPNPFNESTTFLYSLKESSRVTLQIFNSFGQLVAEPVNSIQPGGEQHIRWDAGNLPGGMYYYRLQVGGQVGTGKMIKW